MDPRTHSRYLDYLELRKYFARTGDAPKLAPPEWAELDRELTTLLKKEQAAEATPDDLRRIRLLRRTLFRD